MKRCRIISRLGAITCLLICFQLAAQPANEYKLKAAFIYHFLEFVEWPAESFKSPDSPIIIDILGHDPFGREIDSIFNNKTINGHPIIVERVKALAHDHPCHVVFVCRSERDRVPQILEQLGDRSIFSIGDIDGFANRGGVLNFFPAEANLGFEINPLAVKRARLQVSSKLLRLAKIVGKKGT